MLFMVPEPGEYLGENEKQNKNWVLQNENKDRILKEIEKE